MMAVSECLFQLLYNVTKPYLKISYITFLPSMCQNIEFRRVDLLGKFSNCLCLLLSFKYAALYDS